VNEKKKIAVDLDGTLAFYDHFRGISHIGEPIPAAVQRLTNAVLEGHEVWIFTARACSKQTPTDLEEAIGAIRRWCMKHFGEAFPITADKDWGFTEFWDDRAVQFRKNTGVTVETELALANGQVEHLDKLWGEALATYRAEQEAHDKTRVELEQLRTAFSALQQSADATRQELEAWVSKGTPPGEPDDMREPEVLDCLDNPAAGSILNCLDALDPTRKLERQACPNAPRCHHVLLEKAPNVVALRREAENLTPAE
jgi:hypothetical protein